MEKWMFDVEKRDILVPNEIDFGKHPTKKALVRKDTNEILSLVSDRYQVTQHEDVFNLFNETEGLVFDRYKISDDGGVCFWEFDIKGLEPKEVSVGDAVRFKFRAFNSHNFLTSRGGELIAYRLVCKNGMVVPQREARISFKHVDNDFKNIKEYLEKSYGSIDGCVALWRTWRETAPRLDTVDSFVDKLELGNEEVDVQMRNEMKSSNDLWKIYNVLTYYITHEMKNRGKNKIANQRQKALEYTRLFYKHNWSV